MGEITETTETIETEAINLEEIGTVVGMPAITGPAAAGESPCSFGCSASSVHCTSRGASRECSCEMAKSWRVCYTLCAPNVLHVSGAVVLPLERMVSFGARW